MEEKPEPEINIKVKNQKGEIVCFKMKKSIKFQKLIKTYCQRAGYAGTSSVRFIFNGETLRETDTPGLKKMEDGDLIEAVVSQKGGNSNNYFN